MRFFGREIGRSGYFSALLPLPTRKRIHISRVSGSALFVLRSICFKVLKILETLRERDIVETKDIQQLIMRFPEKLIRLYEIQTHTDIDLLNDQGA